MFFFYRPSLLLLQFFATALGLANASTPAGSVSFTPVFQSSAGNGIGTYNLLSAADLVFAFDYGHSGKLDHLALYWPGTGTFWILHNDNGTFLPVYAQGDPGNGIGGYDLRSAADRVFAFDYDHTSKMDYLALYRPGTGTMWILRNSGGEFTPVYHQGDPGLGIGGYDLKSLNDKAFAFDYNHTGKLDYIALYRPGTGTFWILHNTNGTFSPVYRQGDPGSGIGGYDLLSTADQALAFDYDHSGKLDYLVFYRLGTGTIWILCNSGGIFSPVYHEGDPGIGISSYDLKSPSDRVFACDYDHSGKLDHLALYHPSTGIFWILRNNDNGTFSPVYQQGDPAVGIGGFDLKSPADRVFPFDYASEGKQSYLTLYRPGTGIIWILAEKGSGGPGRIPGGGPDGGPGPNKGGSDGNSTGGTTVKGSGAPGAAIGGIFAIFYFQKWSSRRHVIDIDSEPKDYISTANLTSAAAVQPDLSYLPNHTTTSFTSGNLTPTAAAIRPDSSYFPIHTTIYPTPGPPFANANHNVGSRETIYSSQLQTGYPHSVSSQPSNPTVPVQELTTDTKAPIAFQVSNPAPSSPGFPTGATASVTGSTAEEATFLHSLYSINVLAEEVARMMEVVRAGRQDPNSADQGLVSLTTAAYGGLAPDDAPPQYEVNRT